MAYKPKERGDKMNEEEWRTAISQLNDQEVHDISQAFETLDSWKVYNEAFRGDGMNIVRLLAKLESNSRKYHPKDAEHYPLAVNVKK